MVDVHKEEFIDDGCNYMTEEESEAFRKMATPLEFDSSNIKNKYLNVSYGPLPEQLIDIYLPEEGDGPFPVIFYTHGGGWSMGSKTNGFLDGIIGAIHKGYAVISVDYRLAPHVTFPEFIFDVKSAIRWARAHAAEYNFNPELFGIAGDSAGGNIALTIGFTADRPEYSGSKYGWAGYSDGVQVVCDMFGPSILSTDRSKFFRESGVKIAFKRAADKSEPYKQVFGTINENILGLFSPLNQVHKDIPPVLILHGAIDGVVPYQHSTLLYDKIKEVCGNDRAQFILYEDINHADYRFNTQDNCDEIVRFFDRYLK